MNKKEYEKLKKEYENTKKELSKFDILDACTEILANSEMFKELTKIDSTLMISITMFTGELVGILFDEDNNESEEV